MRPSLIILALALGACAETSFSRNGDVEAGAWEDLDDGTNVDGQVRLDVFPPQDSDLVDPFGDPVVLRPQTFVEEARSQVDLDLVLTPAVTLSGVLEGTALTPWPTAELPSVDDVLANAAIRFGLEGSVQQPRTEADDEGRYQVRIVPSDLPYEVAILPDTPDVPVRVQRVTIDGTDDELDLYLEAGVPVWGTVQDRSGAPLEDMNVVAIDDLGLRSAPVRTDARGRYQLVVAPGQPYAIEASPAGSDILADVRVRTEAITSSGTQADLVYGNDVASAITGVVRAVRVVDGTEVAQTVSEGAVRVRIISEELDGFPDDNARYQVELGTNAGGRFTALAPRGTYRVEISPQGPEGPSPLVVEGVRVGSTTTTVNGLELERKVARQGVVLDEAGQPVGLADIACTELGFAERTFETSADPNGAFVIAIPRTPVACTVTPPADPLRELATTRQRIDSDEDLELEATWVLRARVGSVISGVVRSRRTPNLTSPAEDRIPGAVVQVRDFSGTLLGVAVSDEDGRFEVRVDR